MAVKAPPRPGTPYNPDNPYADPSDPELLLESPGPPSPGTDTAPYTGGTGKPKPPVIKTDDDPTLDPANLPTTPYPAGDPRNTQPPKPPTPTPPPPEFSPDTILGAINGQTATTDPNQEFADLAAEYARRGWSQPPAGAGGTTTGGTTTGGPAPPTVENLLQQRLLELLQRSSMPQDTDPEIAKPLAAGRNAAARAEERGRQILAEQMSYRGQSHSGAMDTGVLGLSQARGTAEMDLEAQLWQDAAQRRVAELQNTLAIAGDQIDAKAKNALQLEIAHLQAATTRAGYASQEFITGRDLLENARQFNLSLEQQKEAAANAGSLARMTFDEGTRRWNLDFNWDKEKFEITQNSSVAQKILDWLAQGG